MFKHIIKYMCLYRSHSVGITGNASLKAGIPRNVENPDSSLAIGSKYDTMDRT
jgi:hypothetical protein